MQAAGAGVGGGPLVAFRRRNYFTFLRGHTGQQLFPATMRIQSQPSAPTNDAPSNIVYTQSPVA
eukprot:scaffold138_cov142-Skeletonema_dohrnii-CCMP3373.AAC.3